MERAARALDTPPAEDQEEMIGPIEDLHNALKEGRTEDAAAVKQNLDEIIFCLEQPAWNAVRCARPNM